jgi:2-dehydro-3-deoxyphosphogluconate aldolase/(4S)-4-hydroxy-2-oxoglutarate aldolase
VEEAGVVPLFYRTDAAVASDIVAACVAGGAMVVEFTNRGDGAHAVFTSALEHVRSEHPSAILGIGSIADAPTAALYIAIGADFIVSPHFNPEIARLCNRRKIPYIPGVCTPTEIARAEEGGAELLKLFPARQLGPDFIRDVLAPSPRSSLIPMGGVSPTEQCVRDWIRGGAVAVGIGSQLIANHPSRPADLDRLPDRIAEIRRWVADAHADQAGRSPSRTAALGR